jgi:twitching motility protein PilI
MREKQSLRDFQTQLADKLKQAEGANAVTSKLGFVAGGRSWLVNLDQVNEVVTVPGLTEAPWSRPWFVGVASVRGALYGCTDLAAYLGISEPMPVGETRLLLVHPRFGVNAAIRIERALGLRTLSDLTPIPLLQKTQPWEVAHWRAEDDQDWVEISMQALVSMPDFLEVGQ